MIGYGECILKESTEGEGLIKLEIPINYRSNRKPTDIILVGSASRYGIILPEVRAVLCGLMIWN